MAEPTTPVNLPLDEHLCFAIYAASHAVQQRHREYLTSWGLTYPQYLVLVTLWDSAGCTQATGDDLATSAGLSVKEIGQRLYLDSGTLSPLLKRLEANDFITRQRSPEDNRRVMIYPTEKAQALRSQVSPLKDGLVEDSGLTPEELRTLRRLARKVTAGLQGKH